MKQSLKQTNMKKYKLFQLLFVVIIALAPSLLMAQDAVEKPTLILSLKYFNDNNKTHHLEVQAKSKIDGKFQMIASVPVQFYIGSVADKSSIIGKGLTNPKGIATVIIPATVKTQWLSTPNQTFVVISTPTKAYGETTGELAITKAKLQIDTAEGRIINAKLLALVDTTWTPIAGVDVIVGVKRLGGILNANETPTYSTDSSGAVMAEFKRDSLPGDNKGNLVLTASVIDNDVYGNLTVEMVAPWGKYYPFDSKFDERTLFARRGYSPLWLEILAYAIIVGVWAIIIHLLLQLRKTIKLGVE